MAFGGFPAASQELLYEVVLSQDLVDARLGAPGSLVSLFHALTNRFDDLVTFLEESLPQDHRLLRPLIGRIDVEGLCLCEETREAPHHLCRILPLLPRRRARRPHLALDIRIPANEGSSLCPTGQLGYLVLRTHDEYGVCAPRHRERHIFVDTEAHDEAAKDVVDKLEGHLGVNHLHRTVSPVVSEASNFLEFAGHGFVDQTLVFRIAYKIDKSHISIFVVDENPKRVFCDVAASRHYSIGILGSVLAPERDLRC